MSNTPDSGKTKEQLIEEIIELRQRIVGVACIGEDITERKQAEENLRIDFALQRMRNEILQMQNEEDWNKVVMAFDEELEKLVSFNACSINLIDLQKSQLTAYAVGPHKGLHQKSRDIIEPALKTAMETQRYVYRPSRTDPLFSKFIPSEVHSVVDVPFVGGTIAINSTEEEAFSSRDLEILEKFVPVISEANRRLEDLHALAEAEERFRQAQKMEAIGQLAGGVAHDFNNVLTAINGYSQLLLMELDPDDPNRVDVEEIRKAAKQGSSLTSQLLAFSRKQVQNLEALNLNRVVAGLEKMLRRLLGDNVEFVLKLDSSLEQVLADEGQIHQILLNLAVNARDAMSYGGKLTIETANVELSETPHHQGVVVDPGPYVRLAVRDTGMGMDAETQKRIFEPFFTTKESGRGTGLGLSMVYGVVKQSKGYIWVHSEPGEGTMFEIYLPCTDKAALERSKETPGMASFPGAETILVVEDDAGVRSVVSRLLRSQGYTVLEAANGEDALRVAQRQDSNIHLLVADVMMPGMNGCELAAAMTILYPSTKVLYMSGYTEGIIDRDGVLEPGTAFLQKPIRYDTLTQKVHEVLDTP